MPFGQPKTAAVFQPQKKRGSMFFPGVKKPEKRRVIPKEEVMEIDSIYMSMTSVTKEISSKKKQQGNKLPK